MTSTIYLSLVLIQLLIVSWRGGVPERAIVLILLASDLSDFAYHWMLGPTDFGKIDYGHFLIDSLTFAALTWVALGANRFWPLPVCSLQLIIETSHFAQLLGASGIKGMYWAMSAIPAYLQLAVVLTGTIAHIRRVRRIGPYRAWRINWPVPDVRLLT